MIHARSMIHAMWTCKKHVNRSSGQPAIVSSPTWLRYISFQHNLSEKANWCASFKNYLHAFSASSLYSRNTQASQSEEHSIECVLGRMVSQCARYIPKCHDITLWCKYTKMMNLFSIHWILNRLITIRFVILTSHNFFKLLKLILLAEHKSQVMLERCISDYGGACPL